MFEVIREDERTTYLEIMGIRAIIREGEYVGWYNPTLSEVV